MGFLPLNCLFFFFFFFSFSTNFDFLVDLGVILIFWPIFKPISP